MKNVSSYKVAGAISIATCIIGLCTASYFNASPRDVPTVDSQNLQVLAKAEETLNESLRKAKLQMKQELEEIKREYTLPPEGTFEAKHSFKELQDQLQQVQAQKTERTANQNKFEVQEVWYEPGYFKSDALVQWQCAWLKSAVQNQEAGKSDEVQKAIQILLGFKESKDIKMFPDYDRFLEDNVTPLQAGNTAPAREFLNSGYSCVAQNQLK